MGEVPLVSAGLWVSAGLLGSRRPMSTRFVRTATLAWATVAVAVAPLSAHAEEVRAPGASTGEVLRERAEPTERLGKTEPDESPSGDDAPLPPLPVSELRARAPSPQWSSGLVLGACGVGTDGFWQATDFCGAVLAEAIFLRQRQADVGLGPYAQVGTSGFVDVRGSCGASLHVPLGEIFHVASRVGPLLLYDGVAAGGVEGFLELGVRGLNREGHYTMTHSVVVGVQQALGATARHGTTAWIGLRLDGFWLALPFALLAR